MNRFWAASIAARASGDGVDPGVIRGKFAGRGRLPLGITTIIGTAFLSAIKLSSINPVRPIGAPACIVVAGPCSK